MHSLLDRAELARLHAQVAGQPVDIGALATAADRALAEERFEDAEKLLRGALIAAPDRCDLWHRLGRLAEGWGEVDQAAEAYRRAMALDEDEVVALDLARLLASGGELEEAYALSTWLALQAESASVQGAASALATSIERREVRHASAR